MPRPKLDACSLTRAFFIRARARRIELGISIVRFSRSIGISRAQYSHYENGFGGITLETAIKISRALGVPLDAGDHAS